MENEDKSKMNRETEIAGPSKPPDQHELPKNAVVLENGLHHRKPGHQQRFRSEQKSTPRKDKFNSTTSLPSKNQKSHQHASKPSGLPSLLDSKIDYDKINKLKADTQLLHKNLNGKIKKKKALTVGFKKLEEWSNKDPHDLMFELVHKMKQFEELLESSMSEDMIVLVIKVLAKLCLSPFKENKTEIMNLASNDKFIARFQNYVVVKLPFFEQSERKNNALFWNDVSGFFENLIVVFESLIQAIPTKACEILPKVIKSIIKTIPTLEAEQNLTLSVDTKQKLEALQEKSELCKTEVEKVRRKRGDYKREPTNDFRQISVYPTAGEIMTAEQTFVRRHRIKGAYDSVGQYLDVQFRLLREDFLAPLRKGVWEYRSRDSRPGKRISNVRIHPHVEFLSPHYSNGQTGVLVQYEFEKGELQAGVRLYRRFMYGALVCFTIDNFSTLFFGKVIERDQNLLEQGRVVIGFDSEGANYKLNVPYLMVEYGVYFEPYYHVLKALQNMQEDKFPMRDYFIDVKTEIELPEYLNGNSIYQINDFQVNLSDTCSWPSANQLELDDTQYEAFKAALTQKFVVIQGPPGTGKTFLGLQIAKTLIKNDNVWYNRTPILVVCYTNHALDQFLEGLIGTTTRIVRVGGQSKNEQLEQFNLINRRKGLRHLYSNTVLDALREQICEELGAVKGLSETLDEIPKFKGIVRFDHFATVDSDLHGSWFMEASSNEIIEWLLFDAHSYLTKDRETSQISLEEEVKAGEGDASDSVVGKELDKLLEDEARNAQAFNEFEYFAELVSSKSGYVSYLVTLSELKAHVNGISKRLERLDHITVRETDEKWNLEHELTIVQDKLDYLQMRLDEGRLMKLRKKPADIDMKHPENIPANTRWRLYFYWLLKYQESLVGRLVELESKHRKTYNQYNEMKTIEDTEIMIRMTVVGMTTTSAARLQSALQALQCRIVIVEEAAEVLESHIVVSLTQHCQHLILIGDHQQLRPSTADYNMEKDYNLGISLFERMVLNNVQCYVLGVQHRMRPEIAKLIVPSIYPKLENHRSVCNFPKILGIDADLYFIDHQYPERESGDSSKKNMHEAEFLLRLACYLVQNGYKPQDVTIISAYSGQMFALWEVRKRHRLLKDVRITVLDNYQGEESKIILLSLVRNNEDNKIGFLKIENRVCVALSRAKEGFYMMGNMNLLCQNSEVWPKVKAALDSQDALGRSLLLRCQIHPAEMARVEVAKDFDKVPEGGCRRKCGGLLKCGHTCPRLCHIKDKEHTKASCMVICSKILCENNHECKKYCYEECGKCTVPMERTLPCSHTQMIPCYVDLSEYKCQIPVETDLPCGHKQKISCSASVSQYQCKIPVEASLPCGHKVQDKPCFVSTETYFCTFPCDIPVEPCGHACQKRCHVKDDPNHLKYKCYKPCLKANVDCSMPEGEEHLCKKRCYEECSPCLIVVKKSRTKCSHYSDIVCSVDANTVECQKPCKKLLPCGHICRKKCYESCENCQEMIEKTHPTCGHPILTKCCEQPDRSNCNKSCPLKLPCGHTCKNKCNQLCTKNCKIMVDYNKPTACGHKFKVNCYLVQKDLPSYSYELLKFCIEPCNTELPCKHVCSGTCGKCVQGRIHQVCLEKCETRLICGHECLLMCHETCCPCTQACSYRCRHNNTCKNKCGEPCSRCNQKCSRQCQHIQCKARCWEICTVLPCSEPCQKKIKCGHPCMGFCGDPCPPLCSVCNNQKVLEIFPSFDDKRNTRFVLMNECKHIVESQEMEDWLKQSEEIKCKSCPKCGIPLTCTHRYSDYVKRNLKDVIEIKKEFFGYQKQNEIRQRELFNVLYNIRSNAKALLDCSPIINHVMGVLRKDLQLTRGRGRQQPLNNFTGQIHAIKINILQIMVDIFARAKLKDRNITKEAVKHIDLVCLLILKQGPNISNQEIVDFRNEMKRLQRIMQFYQIEEFLKYHSTYLEVPKVKQLRFDLNILLFESGNYSDKLDAKLNERLTKLKDMSSVTEIMDIKDVEIMQITGMGKSHWKKCPKQHYYGTNNSEQVTQCSKCSPQTNTTMFATSLEATCSNQLIRVGAYVDRPKSYLKVPGSSSIQERLARIRGRK